LVDIESYKKIIGAYEKHIKQKEHQTEYDSSINFTGLFSAKNRINRMHILTDAFSLDRNFDYSMNLGAKPESNFGKEYRTGFELNEKEAVLLIKASEYV
jgi:hypothetical protein